MLEFYFNLNGRISRRDYCLKFFLALFIFEISVSIVIGILDELTKNNILLNLSLSLFNFFFFLTVIWVSSVGSIRRLHDRGWSGKSLILLFIPLISLWPLFECLFLPGVPGPNRHGENPLDLR